MLLNDKEWALVESIDCTKCADADMCDQVKYDCPKVDFKGGFVDEEQFNHGECAYCKKCGKCFV